MSMTEKQTGPGSKVESARKWMAKSDVRYVGARVEAQGESLFAETSSRRGRVLSHMSVQGGDVRYSISLRGRIGLNQAWSSAGPMP